MTMNQPSPLGKRFTWWSNAAYHGVFGPIHDDHPECGYYRVRQGEGAPWLPVAISLDQPMDAESGELEGDEEVLCLVGFNGTAKFRDASKLWTWVAKAPVTWEAYKQASETGVWPDAVPGDNMGPTAGTYAELYEQLTNAIGFLDSFGVVKDKNTSDQVSNLKDRILSLAKRFELMKKEEQEPHNEAIKIIRGRFDEMLGKATAAVARCRELVRPYMLAVDQAAQAAHKAAQAEAEAVAPGSAAAIIAPRVRTGGMGGRKTGLKTVTIYTITDFDAALCFVKDQEDVKEAVRKAATRMAKAGIVVPGVTITTGKDVT